MLRARRSQVHDSVHKGVSFALTDNGRLVRINNEPTSVATARRLLPRLCRSLAAPLLVSVLTLVVFQPLTSMGALASTSTTSMRLVQQSNWVGTRQGFSISINVNAPVPSNNLVLRVRLYPRLSSRYALEHSPLEGNPTETLNNVSISPPSAQNPSTAQTSTVQFRVITAQGLSGGPLSARALHIDCLASTCDGNYPLTLTLLDRTTHQQLSSLTTTLTYLGDVGTTTPLDVAVALPIDISSVTSAPNALSATEIANIATVAHLLLADHTDAISLSVYGRLLAQLETDAAANPPISTSANNALAALVRLASRTRTVELLRAPFTPIDLNAIIAGAGVSMARQELQSQLDAANVTTAEALHAALSPSPYVSPIPLSPAAASLLSATGVCNFALPTSNIALNVGAQGIVSPFTLTNVTATCPTNVAMGAAVDAGFNADIADAVHAPVLAAHRLIADLAQTYFENPNAFATRGVIVAPSQWNVSPVFVATLLAGLHANPVLSSVTLNTFFHDVVIGAGNGPTSGTLQSVTDATPVSATAINRAYSDLSTLKSISPSDQGLVENLIAQIFNGEGVGLTSNQRTQIFLAPKRAIETIASSLHLTGSSHVTFTANSGTIPITIHYTGPVLPVHVDLRIRSSTVDIPAHEALQHLVLTLRDTNESLKVSTRTSGAYSLNLELLVPHQQTVLLGPADFTITSTAASGVAIALSLGALFVLGLWWTRSILRHRRAKIAKSADQPKESGSILHDTSDA